MVFDLCSRLVWVSYMRFSPGGGERWRRIFVMGIPFLIGPKTGHRGYTYQFLRKAIRQLGPAVWHTHLGGDIWGGLAAWQNKTHPWITTAHNTDHDDRWALHQARGLAFRRADHVICVSRTVQNYLQQEFGVKEDRTMVIRHGVDLSLCPQRGDQLFRDVPHIISVGRLTRQKGHGTLLEALAMVKRPWRLTIIGQGPEESPLRRQAADLGILPRIQFLGSVTDIPRRLSEADLFCFPSRWEGQGLVLLEAMACGIPVIASDLPVFRETFDEHSMQFAEPGNSSLWGRGILHTLARPQEALDRARVARQIVSEHFRLDAMVGAYAALYERWRNPFQP